MSKVEELKNQIKELEKQLEFEEEKEKNKFTFPFNVNEEYCELQPDGIFSVYHWKNLLAQKMAYAQGNVFKKVEDAQLERQKRELLMKFKQFRDKCNGDWKPDFKDSSKDKYIIYYDYEFLEFYCSNLGGEDEFHLFGYFKNQKDCKRAIELFGDEIKKLYVEAEYE